MNDTPCCSCCTDAPDNPQRRRVIQIAAAGLVVPGSVLAAAADGPKQGDLLVEEDAEGTPTPLRLADLRPAKPVLAFPFDAKTKTVRNSSRLNKVVLVRLPEADLAPAAKARSASGVVAYSAICTHQACDVKTWLSKEKVLVCFCHSSKFELHEAGKVTAGPALRALPSLPLKLDGETLVVAGSFSSAPGGHT